MRLARELDQPLLLWHDHSEGPPLVAPVLAAQHDRVLSSLRFSLSLKDTALPKDLYSTPKPLRGELTEAKRLVAQWKNYVAFMAEQERLERSGTVHIIGERELQITRSEFSATRQKIAEHNTCIRELRRWWQRLYRIQRDFGKRRDPSIRAATQELGQLLQRNEHTLRWFDEQTERGDQEMTFAVATCEKSSGAKKRHSNPSRTQLGGARALEEARAELNRWRDIAVRFQADDVRVFVDSGLRGIPLSISDEKRTRRFDGWVSDNQPRLWAEFEKQAQEQGVDFRTEDSAAGLLHASNIVMSIEQSADQLKVSPHFVLSGPFFQVIDPQRGLVYYESAIAEHHLSSSPHNEEAQ